MGGYFLGAAALGSVLFVLELGAARWFDSDRDLWPVGGIVLALFAGDLWAVGRGRMYPLGPRRQARKTLMYSGRSPSTVALIWGFDAGLGLTTFRMTSGIWLLGVLAVLGLVGAWLVLVYAAGFVVGLLLVIFWPVRRLAGDRPQVVTNRILRMGGRRRGAQVAYVLLFPFAVGWVLSGSPGP